jgi:rubrerythrin
MMATREHEKQMPEQMPETIEEEGPEVKEERALRRCTVCGTEFEGDPTTSLPVCSKCQKTPEHPEEVPL